MGTRYVGTKTAQFYEATTGRKTHPALIFGDEVEATGNATNQRVPIKFRDLTGYIAEDNLQENPVLEIYFIDVGQGDSTFIVTPGRKKILIDGGVDHRALGFLAWKYRLAKLRKPIDIDLLVLTHADGDHLDGLVPIVQHPLINVKQVVHSGVAVYEKDAFATVLGDIDSAKKSLLTTHDGLNTLKGQALSPAFEAWKKALAAEKCPYRCVDSETGTLDVGDPTVTIEVLGPRPAISSGAVALPWYGDASKTINGNSVVLKVSYKALSLLLAGDVNGPSSDFLLGDPSIAARLDAHVFKAPHHGSHDYSREFLEAVSPQISVISSGDEPDHGHPRAVFIGAVGRASRSDTPLVFSTEIAATFQEVKPEPVTTEDMNEVDTSTSAGNATARVLFKRRLHGMINVRTDGRDLYAARRVAAGYYWESYGPLAAARRP